jgi:hypothetical protein
MPNHDRDEMNNNVDGQSGLIALGLTLLGGAVFGALGRSRKNAQEAQEIQEQIAEIDQEIEGYRSKFLGEIMYADEIEELEAKCEELRKRL